MEPLGFAHEQRVFVRDVRGSHDNIAERFQYNRPLEQMVQDLLSGRLCPDDVPLLSVIGGVRA